MDVGYARVSTLDQNLDLQRDALTAAGCGRIFEDKASGAKSEREGLVQCLAYLRSGQDTLIVWKLDRLGRSLTHLVEVVTDLEKRGIGFKSLKESIDTTSSVGKLIFHIFAALAEFERNLIKERTTAGLISARVRGRMGGRPRILTVEKKRMAIALLNANPPMFIKEVAAQIGVSPSTLYQFYAAHRKSGSIATPCPSSASFKEGKK